MGIQTIKAVSKAPVAQKEIRMRTAADLWRKIRELNDSDAARMKIAAAYWELGEVLELLPERYRIVLGGSIRGRSRPPKRLT